jgi:hypothetical protein
MVGFAVVGLGMGKNRANLIHEGRRTVALLEKIYESARAGEPLKVG